MSSAAEVVSVREGSVERGKENGEVGSGGATESIVAEPECGCEDDESSGMWDGSSELYGVLMSVGAARRPAAQVYARHGARAARGQAGCGNGCGLAWVSGYEKAIGWMWAVAKG